MFSIRKVRTGSNSIAVQVVLYQGHKSKIIKHIGSGKAMEEISTLIEQAQQWIDSQTKQVSLFAEPQPKTLYKAH